MSDFFMNDRYRVLECMAQRQIIVNDEAVVKLSQQEIADTLPIIMWTWYFTTRFSGPMC